MNRGAVIEWVRNEYGTEPRYPWAGYSHAVLCHPDNKWYGIVMSVPKNKLGLDATESIDILNVKCAPVLMDSLRMERGFFPAYHMNKKHWISISLDGSVPDDEIKMLIDLSYNLTDKTKKANDAFYKLS